MIEVRIRRLRPGAVLPAYAHGPDEDAGLDLVAAVEAVLEPGRPQAVPTGIAIELEPGFEGQIRPRSGLALRHAVTVANAPGTIDPGYRGEVQVLLVNLGREPFHVAPGDRIAQLVVSRYQAVRWSEGELAPSRRGQGGFGSSGR